MLSLRGRLRSAWSGLMRRIAGLPRRALIAITAVVALVAAGGVVWLVMRSGPSAEEVAAAEAVWGVSPDGPGETTLQDNVRLIPNGALAVRGTAPDGTTYYLDRGHGGIGDLRVGDVLFLTNRIVGQVVQLEEHGDDEVAVSLIPVDLPQVFAEADLSVDQDIDGTALQASFAPPELRAIYPNAAPDSATAGTEESGDGAAVHNGGFHGGGFGTGLSAFPLPRADGDGTEDEDDGSLGCQALGDKRAGITTNSDHGTSACVKWEDWTFGGKASTTGAHLEAWQNSENTPIGVKVDIGYQSLHLASRIRIAKGGYGGEPEVVLSGLRSLAFRMTAGLGEDLTEAADLQAAKTFEWPVKLGMTAFVDGIPLYFEVEVKMTMTVGLGAKNSTILFTGSYSFDGDLGYQGGTWITPTVTPTSSVLNSISGVSLGHMAVIFAIETKVTGGLGTNLLSAGPYAAVDVAIGVAKGSALVSTWYMPCLASQFISAKVGLGVTMSLPVADKIAGTWADTMLSLYQKGTDVLGLSKDSALAFEDGDWTLTILEKEATLFAPGQESTGRCRGGPPAMNTDWYGAGDGLPSFTGDKTQSYGDDPYGAPGAPDVPGPESSPPPLPDAPESDQQERPERNWPQQDPDGSYPNNGSPPKDIAGDPSTDSPKGDEDGFCGTAEYSETGQADFDYQGGVIDCDGLQAAAEEALREQEGADP